MSAAGGQLDLFPQVKPVEREVARPAVTLLCYLQDPPIPRCGVCPFDTECRELFYNEP